jgi:hypothetical protein
MSDMTFLLLLASIGPIPPKSKQNFIHRIFSGLMASRGQGAHRKPPLAQHLWALPFRLSPSLRLKSDSTRVAMQGKWAVRGSSRETEPLAPAGRASSAFCRPAAGQRLLLGRDWLGWDKAQAFRECLQGFGRHLPPMAAPAKYWGAPRPSASLVRQLGVPNGKNRQDPGQSRKPAKKQGALLPDGCRYRINATKRECSAASLSGRTPAWSSGSRMIVGFGPSRFPFPRTL